MAAEADHTEDTAPPAPEDAGPEVLQEALPVLDPALEKVALRLAEAVDLTHELADVLEEETEALRQHDREGFTAIQSDKSEVAQEYKDLMTALEKRRDLVAQLPEEHLEPFRAARERLEVAMEDNLNIVDAARRGTRIVIETILEAARKAVLQTDGYQEDASKSKAEPPPSVSVNKDV